MGQCVGAGGCTAPSSSAASGPWQLCMSVPGRVNMLTLITLREEGRNGPR